MKKQFTILVLSMSLRVTSLLADDASTSASTGSTANFYIGHASFPRGDSIEITSVDRLPDRMVVKGHYKLVSADSAELSLYTTTTAAIAVPTDRTQLMKISRGQGDFELTDPNLVPGLNHVTMYSIPGGKPFAGVYFGNKEEADKEGKLDLDYYADASGSNGNTVSASGPNQALLEYLGNPVEPPANMDARYSKEGLLAAIQLAAQNAGIKIKKVMVDDSEYPFLIGVVCAGSDAVKLKDQLEKMDGYGYSGSVGNDSNRDGSDTCNVFSIVPYSAHPRAARQQIDHRLMLRQQVFYDRIITQQ